MEQPFVVRHMFGRNRAHHRLGELIDQVVHGGFTVSASASACPNS
jgi:hypothetical protein